LDFSGAHPDVVVLKESGPLAIRGTAGALRLTLALRRLSVHGKFDVGSNLVKLGRLLLGFLPTRFATCFVGPRGFASRFRLAALVGGEVASPGRVAYLEPDCLATFDVLDAVEGEPVSLVLGARCLGQRGCQLVVIERGRARPALGIDYDELPGSAF